MVRTEPGPSTRQGREHLAVERDAAVQHHAGLFHVAAFVKGLRRRRAPRDAAPQKAPDVGGTAETARAERREADAARALAPERTHAADQALAAELRASVKDRAENIMIVDVLRNDLGRVCETGSVEVPGVCELESFAQVHHLVSTVRGRLRPDLDAFDLLRACFPGGSITGAPKVRAMQRLEAIEPVRRHVYTGAIGWVGWNGDADWSIAIRTAVATADRIVFHAGGGITADSDPEAEYRESLDKAEGLRLAFSRVLGDIALTPHPAHSS